MRAAWLGGLVAISGCNAILGIDDVNAPLVLIVDGPGRVQSSTITLDCTRKCTVPVKSGEQVVLDAVPLAGANASFSHWEGVPCPSADCIVAGGVTSTITAHFDGPNWVFFDRGPYQGNLGGLAGADADCNAVAQKHDLTGHYVAYLSSSTQLARDRFRAGAHGWLLVDGEPVVDTLDDLVGHKMRVPIYRDADGTSAVDTNNGAWTGTLGDGTIAPDTCLDWTVATASDNGKQGNPSWGGRNWSDFGQPQCKAQNRGLYCFEDDRGADLPPSPARNGRIAFVGTGFTASTGINSADMICHDQAAAASLPGTYRALLATSTASAASRFDLNGPTWVRVDGLPLAATASDFMNGQQWLAPLDFTADGQPADLVGGIVTWNGARLMTAPGTAATTCNDWSSSNPSDMAQFGQTNAMTIGDSFGQDVLPCDETQGVYCLQM